VSKSDKPLRVAPTHGIEHREISRLSERVETQAEIISAWGPLIDKMEEELAQVRRFANCRYVHLDTVCTKCGFPGHIEFSKEKP
jgi:hypothetical protein